MIRISEKWILLITRNSMVQHVLFWGLSWYILLNIFAGSSSFQKIDFIYTSIFLVSIIIPVEFNLIYLIPKLLNRKRYVLYALIFIGLMLLFSLFNQVLFNRLIDYILPGYYFISYYSYIDILKFFFVFVVVTTLIHLSMEWFELNESRQKVILLEKEKLDAELRALTNQVNPHFLFNSLNVLYSLAINQAKETPDAIIKLADILRYVIYESNHNYVELTSEVKLIQNYIDLQRLRTTPDSDIRFNEEIEDKNTKIAPMLFLPLVENSFKHGIKGDVGKTFIHIDLSQSNSNIEFVIKNNKGQPGEPAENRGVGLNNIRSRLELIYKKNFTFEVEDEERAFTVRLKINLE